MKLTLKSIKENTAKNEGKQIVAKGTVIHHVSGDYVLTGIPNAFNDQTGYWISKKGYVSSFYCFTAKTNTDLKEQLAHFDTYIKYFELSNAETHAAQAKRDFMVETPLGKLHVYAKHATDTPEDFPGVFVDLVRDGEADDVLACVEYCPGDKDDDYIQSCVYQPEVADPVSITIHDIKEECTHEN